MTFIDAVSNRSRITCIMVVAESDWMRIQNLSNRIGCGVKKTESAHLWWTVPIFENNFKQTINCPATRTNMNESIVSTELTGRVARCVLQKYQPFCQQWQKSYHCKGNRNKA